MVLAKKQLDVESTSAHSKNFQCMRDFATYSMPVTEGRHYDTGGQGKWRGCTPNSIMHVLLHCMYQTFPPGEVLDH